jgi:hypothetical protein
MRKIVGEKKYLLLIYVDGISVFADAGELVQVKMKSANHTHILACRLAWKMA